MGMAWGYIQEWIDAQFTTVKDAQLAKAIGFRQSNFATWRNPKQLPSREAIAVIADFTGRTYKQVLDAFLHDTRYDVRPTDAEIQEAVTTRRTRAAVKTSGPSVNPSKR